MKKAKKISILLLIFSYVHSYSQEEFIVEINRIDGSYTKTGPAISGVTFIYPDDRSFNENTGTFIFQSADVDHRLYSIHVSNDSIITNPIVYNMHSLQVDKTSNILYGLKIDTPNNLKSFVSINTVLGTCTQIGNSLPNSSSYSGNFSTFNTNNHRYIFLEPTNILYTIDCVNGNIISNPTLSLSAGENIVNFSYDNLTGTLYGLLQDNNPERFFLVAIDSSTGISTRIGTGTIYGGSGSSAIDELNQQYIYLYNTSAGYEISTFDLITGQIINHALIVGYNGNDNFNSLKYDNINQKLYALHWETYSTQISQLKDVPTDFTVFPNPAADKLNLRVDLDRGQCAEIQIYDLEGKLLLTKTLEGNDVNEISIASLSQGLYIYKLNINNTPVNLGKLSILR